MRRSKKNENQLALDFGFSETIETISVLENQLDKLDQEFVLEPQPIGIKEDEFTSDRTNFKLDNNPTVVKTTRDSFTGVENSRAMGTRSTQTTEGTRDRGISNPIESYLRATRKRESDTIEAQTTEQSYDRLRDPQYVRDRIATIREQAENKPSPVIKENYHIEPNGLTTSSPKIKCNDNIAAIKLLRTLDNEKRLATNIEKAVLAKYIGWGGIPQVFDSSNEDWQIQFNELRGLLSDEEYSKARASTLDAHYTPEILIKNIYQGLDRIGFKGGKVLEPSVGSGNFFGFMPKNIKKKSELVSVEIDTISHKITKNLYPVGVHLNKGFHEVLIPKNSHDLVIGNPPFGNYSLYDAQFPNLRKLSIHNFFIAKSIETLRPGGIAAFVVSRYFLDAKDSTARQNIAEKADLLGAIRLPNNSFKENAFTEVTTDIVFFQRKEKDRNNYSQDWIQTAPIEIQGESYHINQYYRENPEQILGELAQVSGQFGFSLEVTSNKNNNELDNLFIDALKILPENIYENTTVIDQEEEIDPNKELIDSEYLEKYKTGAFFVTPLGKVAIKLPEVLGKVDFNYFEAKNIKAVDRIKGMIEIRDTLRNLFKLEQNDSISDNELNIERQKLNSTYDQFLRKFGHISNATNKSIMKNDPEWALLQALEKNYDKGVSRETAKKNDIPFKAPYAEKADIFNKRVLSPKRIITQVETPKDALVVSMNEVGKVDIDLMCHLTKLASHKIISDLQGMIFHNPKTQQWETKDIYLTGNVKEKLKDAILATETDKKYEENVEQLKIVQPIDLDPVDISIQLGSTWVPSETVKQFISDTLKVNAQVAYLPALGKWTVDIPKYRVDETLNTVTWGTSRYLASDLITSILQNKTIQVKDDVVVNGETKPVINEKETSAAHQKADELKQEFVDWVWQDIGRRDQLSTLYNSKFNTDVPTAYDGSHLTLPTASDAIKLRPSQKNGIWRAIQTGSVLFDHVVGAGKTFTCIGAAMESKRMGLLQKPMFVVPNHLTLEWKDAFYQLYPNANILVADKTDFIKQNREKFFAKIAVGEWDAVIIGHSSFKKIAMPKNTLDRILNEQVNDLLSAISKLRSENGDRLSIKELEKAHKRMSEQLKKRSDTGSKDHVVDFADLGVDSLFVDEAHEFKNLFITTSQSRIAGLGNIQGSDKAFDLFVKIRYLQEKNNGKGVFFATGTPISNTIAEVFTMQRYMQYDKLKQLGIAHFDAWASTFGQIVTGWELDATGVNYKINSRFSKFQNVPELTALYRSFSDVISTNDLHSFAEAEGKRFPIPKLKNERPTNVIVKRSNDQANFMGVQTALKTDEGDFIVNEDGIQTKVWNKGSIIYRMENLPDDPSIDNPLKITNEARKAGLDFRLINPEAVDHPDSKINVAIEKIFEIWEKNTFRKGTQLVFCDLSTPKTQSIEKKTDQIIDIINEQENQETETINMDELLSNTINDGKAFSVYDDIKKKLISMGIPEDQVKFIHDAKTDIQKAKLFEKMNQGEVRILLGSTSKMGAGTNVQKRLVALHNLDAPWRPSDLEQREGRIKRQGNMFYEQNPENFEIEIFRYATEQTYDSRMWQTIEIKASGIEQFRKGDSLLRVIDDITGEAANAADMKAAASGNPLILMQVKLATELKKVEAVYSSFNKNKFRLERQIQHLENWKDKRDEKIQNLEKIINFREANKATEFKSLDGKVFKKDDIEHIGKIVLTGMKTALEHNKSVQIGSYKGFEITVEKMIDGVYFSLLTPYSNESPSNLEYRKGQGFNINGFFTRVNNHINGYEEKIENVHVQSNKDQIALKNAKIEYDKPFVHEARLKQLRDDNRTIISELRNVQADDSYVSKFTPQSLSVVSKTVNKP